MIIAAAMLITTLCYGTGSVKTVHAAKGAGDTPISKSELEDFRSNLLSAVTKHLDLLTDSNGNVVPLKGKSADGMMAISFYIMYEMTGNQRYRTAALQLADRIVRDMKATPFGVIYIKDKEDDDGEVIAGGGPPAFGWYTAYAAYILHKEGGRSDDLKYIATVLDNFPWNENGWWASAIDVNTGIPKESLEEPSIINKNASIAMSAAMVSDYIKNIDPALSHRLKNKADKCIYSQIIPAQEADGFWHYGLNGNDPDNKDILGYFMVTTHAMIQLQEFAHSYRNHAFKSALDKAYTFALEQIAPMTDPNDGPPSYRTTSATPTHYTLNKDPKRGFALGLILFGGENFGEGVKIIDYWMQNFPYGDAGQKGAHAVHPSVLMLLMLQKEVGKIK